MSENKNMELWDKVCKTDPKLTKNVAYGKRKYTTVCAQSQRRKATKSQNSLPVMSN